MNYRIFVEKRPQFDIESDNFLKELQTFTSLKSLKIYHIYDLFNLSEKQYEMALTAIIDEVTDVVHTQFPSSENQNHFAIEFLPGQFDQRAYSAEQCISLVTHTSGHQVMTGKLWSLHSCTPEELQKIKNYLINPVDSREKNLSKLELPEIPKPNPVPTVAGFTQMSEPELKKMYQDWDFAFGLDDLQFIQSYFQKEKRNPTETELKVLDTYWSDHCRHTTFMTELEEINFEGDMARTIKQVFQRYLSIRKELNREHKPISLMDMGTIAAKYFRAKGKLNDWVISDEINACTIEVEVEVEGKKEDWYLLFKNETHNHPTEIEPFGGASTCVGGAIRDPLSGRAFVYQAMRISGSGNPLQKWEDTLAGKLPQKKITQQAAKGFSSYGNQIGLATSHIAEIYDPGYIAKRMEVGFVAGAVPKDWVRREAPQKGDVIIVVGGKTGRDGVGGATGSSKVQDEDAIEELGSEVQKGDAVEERKIQRLFRKKEVTQLIKKCNDFGAGGVSVAIGEIADSLLVDLNKLPTKYAGLNGTELAISESQERMAVVVQEKDADQFIQLAEEENVGAVKVAEVTDSGRMQMTWNGEILVDLDREFLNSAGIIKKIKPTVSSTTSGMNIKSLALHQKNYEAQLSKLSVCAQKGLIENFDSHVGQSTVLMPLGGKYQMTPALASVHTLPVLNQNTSSVSIATWGFSTYYANRNPFLMGSYAVVESLAKFVASGGNYQKARLSFQEYFERLNEDSIKWGQPIQAVLGALEAQLEFETPAIGGKDSMSGTYKDIHVPPTLISFACGMGELDQIISPEFKKSGNYIYYFKHECQKKCLPNYTQLKENFQRIHTLIKRNKVVSVQTISEGGMAVALFKMGLGNRLGFEIQTEEALFDFQMGSMILESTEPLDDFIELGKVKSEERISINGETFDWQALEKAYSGTLSSIFPEKTNATHIAKPLELKSKVSTLQVKKIAKPETFIPIFPGTNCEFETEKVWRETGTKVQTQLFVNSSEKAIEESVGKFVKAIESAQIINIPGGFSAGDEPDGSAKYIVAVLNNPLIKEAIHSFIQRGGLMLGICNGFQALVKSGLLPYGEIRELNTDSPTLTFNSIGRHISQMAHVKVVSEQSPWLSGMLGQEYCIPFSHGEGRFYAPDTEIQRLARLGQIATQYCYPQGKVALDMPFNPNGSTFGIEGITDPSGQIYGRMGHPERYRKGLMRNIPEVEFMNIFTNAYTFLMNN